MKPGPEGPQREEEVSGFLLTSRSALTKMNIWRTLTKEVKKEQDGHRSKLTERQDRFFKTRGLSRSGHFYKIYNKEIQFLVWRWSEPPQNLTSFVPFTRLHVDEVKMFEAEEGTGHVRFCKVWKGRFGWINWTLSQDRWISSCRDLLWFWC